MQALQCLCRGELAGEKLENIIRIAFQNNRLHYGGCLDPCRLMFGGGVN